MKGVAASVILLLFAITGFAQAGLSKESFFAGLRKVTLNLKGVSLPRELPRYHLSHINDNRPDTIRFGMYLNQFGKPCQLQAPKRLKQVFREQLHQDSAKTRVTISIEEFWIINNYIIDTLRQIGFPNRSGLIFKLKAYIQAGDSWQPLVMIDTSIVSMRTVQNGDRELLDDALELTSRMIREAIELQRYKKRALYTRAQLDSIWRQRYQLPIYSDTAYEKGAYLSLEDLQQNRVTGISFRFEYTDEQAPMLFTRAENGIESPAHFIPALSDGKSLYLVYFGHAFPLFREGRAFYCLGLTSFKDRGAPLPVFLPLGGASVYGFSRINARVRQVLSPRLLNLETGALYD